MKEQKTEEKEQLKNFKGMDAGCVILFLTGSCLWLAFYWFTAEDGQRRSFHWVVLAQVAIGLVLLLIGFFKKPQSWGEDKTTTTHNPETEKQATR